MNRSLIVVLGALALGAAVFAGSYFVSQRAGVVYCANPADDLSWLRKEFHLNDAEMARIRQLHESYLPQCAKMCALIAAKKAEVQAALANGTNVTAEAAEKIDRTGRTSAPNARRRCSSISLPSARPCRRSKAAGILPKWKKSRSVPTRKSSNPCPTTPATSMEPTDTPPSPEVRRGSQCPRPGGYGAAGRRP